MKRIKIHYRQIEEKLRLDEQPLPAMLPDKTMVILVSKMNRPTLYAVRFAKSFQPAHLQAVHVAIDPAEGELVRKQWEVHVPEVPIEILYSEYRDLMRPVLDYLKGVDRRWDNDNLIVVIPQFVPEKFWHQFLHNQTTLRLRYEIERDPDIHAEILDVPIKITSQLR